MYLVADHTARAIQRQPPTTLHADDDGKDSESDCATVRPGCGSRQKQLNQLKRRFEDTDSSDDEGNDAVGHAAIQHVIDSIAPETAAPVTVEKPASLASSSQIARKVADNQLQSTSVWGYSPGAIIPGKANDFQPITGGHTFQLYDSVSDQDTPLEAVRGGLSSFQASVDREARNQHQDARVQSSNEYEVTFAGQVLVRGGGEIGCGSKYRRRDGKKKQDTGTGDPAAAAGGGHQAAMVGSVPLGTLSDPQMQSIETKIAVGGHHIVSSCAGRLHTNSACRQPKLGGGLEGGVDATGKAENFLKVGTCLCCGFE